MKQVLMRRYSNPIGLLLAVVLSLTAPAASAKDSWTSPYPGISLLHRTSESPRLDMRVVFIDLKAPGVRLTVTPPSERRQTVSSFARSKGVAAAINGDFFNYADYSTGGLTVGEGKRWKDTEDQRHTANLVTDGKVAAIIPAKVLLKPEKWMTQVVSGHPILVQDGKHVPTQDAVAAERHPRTAVGLSRNHRTLMLLVVDGRQSSSVGMTGPELARTLIKLGAWSAFNMDGGGSSTMYVAGKGVVNSPSDGRERVVANHLGVFASRKRGTVRGTVTDEAGKPLAGVKIKIGDQTAVTGPKGRFKLYPKPGKLELSASKAGYRPGKRGVRAESREVTWLKLKLARETLGQTVARVIGDIF